MSQQETQPHEQQAPQGKSLMQSFSEQIAHKLIEKLEAGEIPWRKEWKDNDLSQPYNPTTNQPYRGGNFLRLMLEQHADPRWLTYKQAAGIGAQVRKGEKSTPIIFWKTEDYVPVRDENGQPVLDENGKEKKELCKLERPRPFVSHVFNADQIDGMPPLEQEQRTLNWEPYELAEEVITNSGANIVVSGNVAAYRPSTDKIYLPERESFETQAGFYSTALHELSHWTAHESRLNRNIANKFGTPAYAREELRAELASAAMCMEIGVPNMQLDNNAAYVGSWIKVLKNDPKEILRAASDAEKIRRFLVEPVLERHRGIEKKAVQQSKPSEKKPQVAQEDRLYLTVPYKERNEAKSMGAEWDRAKKSWFISKKMPMESFTRWLPQNTEAMEQEVKKEFSQALEETEGKLAALKQEAENRLYLVVPYKEKDEAKKLGAKWDKVEKSWYAEVSAETQEEVRNRFEQWLPGLAPEQEPAISPAEELQEHLEEKGAIIPNDGVLLDGQEHSLEKQNHETSISYTATNETPLPSGIIQDENGSETWTYKGGYTSPEAAQDLEIKKQLHWQELLDDIKEKEYRAEEASIQRYGTLSPASGQNPYLMKNGICVHAGMKEDNDKLVVPLQDISQKSFLTCDLVNDSYKFVPGASSYGMFYVVDDEHEKLSKSNVIIVTSSVADACIIKETTGHTTVSAISLGNIALVTKKLHEHYPDKAIVVAPPDLKFIMGQKAGEVFSKHIVCAGINGVDNVSIVTPCFGLHNHDCDKQEAKRLSHWADLRNTRFGKDGIKAQIDKAVSQALERIQVKTQTQEQTKKNAQVMSR